MSALDRIKSSGRIPKAVAYARYSSDNQRAESIDAQLRAIEDYAGRNGIQLTHTYVDKALSGTSDNRPEFQKMILDSQSGNFDIVLVHKLDRFARNRYDSIGYRMELKKQEVSVVSVLENLDEDAPESVILESVLEGMNEYYSRNLSHEVMKGMRENALKCMHVGGLPPLGYDVDPESHKYVINESESRGIRFIFKSLINGKGYSTIIQELNTMGIKTKRGCIFGKNSLYEILRNEKYHGVYVFNRASSKNIGHKRNNHSIKNIDEIIRIEDGVPRIISDEDFYRVQDILNSRKMKPMNGKGKETYTAIRENLLWRMWCSVLWE